MASVEEVVLPAVAVTAPVVAPLEAAATVAAKLSLPELAAAAAPTIPVEAALIAAVTDAVLLPSGAAAAAASNPATVAVRMAEDTLAITAFASMSGSA